MTYAVIGTSEIKWFLPQKLSEPKDFSDGLNLELSSSLKLETVKSSSLSKFSNFRSKLLKSWQNSLFKYYLVYLNKAIIR